MTNKEIIAMLQKQHEEDLETIRELRESVRRLQESIDQLTENFQAEKRLRKGIEKISQNKSERQEPPQMTEEEWKAREAERAARRKARGNNNAVKSSHLEIGQPTIRDVYPDDPNLDLDTAIHIGGDTYVRYVLHKARVEKIIYQVHAYKQGDVIYKGKAPKAAFRNSEYDGTLVAHIGLLRFVYSMPIERIIKYFEEMGFHLNKPTAHGLVKKCAGALERMGDTLKEAVLNDRYINCDETYYRILVPVWNEAGKHSKKGYIWVLIGVGSGLVYMIYDDGSRSEDVILKEFTDRTRHNVVQSDGYTAYKKMESDENYPQIIRLACFQHNKRKFIDCGEDSDAKEIVALINQLYHEDHQHRIGEHGWTVDDNLRWRQQYAPPILKKIRGKLDEILSRKDLPPKSDLAVAANYMDGEWDALCRIFSGGDYALDNNLVERYNRYLSLSRRNSLFFGSHEGAERGALLYSFACSCRMNGISFFDYVASVLNKLSEIPKDAPNSAYRHLLPDQWKA